MVVHGVCCAWLWDRFFFFALNVHFKVRTGPWLWDRLFGRRGHRREEHEGGGGVAPRGLTHGQGGL